MIFFLRVEIFLVNDYVLKKKNCAFNDNHSDTYQSSFLKGVNDI